MVLLYCRPEAVELALNERHDEIAAVFYDGKPGMYDIPIEFTRFVREITRELGLPMVMDEVVSFRAGYSGYQGVCGVDPDLTVFGKIVGGGFPVGAIGGRADLMDVLDNSGVPTGLRQSGTFSGNNFTLAAGLATLRALTPAVYQHLDDLGERLHEGLVQVFRASGVPCQVVSQGSIVTAHLSDRPVRDYRSAARADSSLARRIALALGLRGYYVTWGLSLALSAPMGDRTRGRPPGGAGRGDWGGGLSLRPEEWAQTVMEQAQPPPEPPPQQPQRVLRRLLRSLHQLRWRRT